jgi:hypothetical protein
MGSCLAAAAALVLGAASAPAADMTFFVTSVGAGAGANLGGLTGADKHCQDLAAAVGAGGHTWHAYLSTQGPGAVNARDRIDAGPWKNAKGEVVARASMTCMAQATTSPSRPRSPRRAASSTAAATRPTCMTR